MLSDIGNKIIQMTFENKQFEKNIAKSNKSVEDFKETLDFDKTSKGLKDFAESANSLKFDNLERNIQKLADRFTGLGDAGDYVLRRIRSSIEGAIEQFEGFVRSVSTDQIGAGQAKYDALNKAVMTIISTGKYTEEQAYAVFERLMTYTNETSYSFADMVNQISTFTGSGLGLVESERAMEGIANLSAKAGQGVSQASSAMQTFSKAMGQGYLSLIQWQSLTSTAHITTEDFRQVLVDAAVAQGTLKKEGDKYYTATKNGQKTLVDISNLENTLNKQWATSAVLMEALQKYYFEGIDDPDADWDTFAGTAAKAAQRALSLADAINAMREASSAHWMDSFRIIFGDLTQAMDLFTNIANRAIEMIDKIGESINSVLRSWSNNGGRDSLIEILLGDYGKDVEKGAYGFFDIIEDAGQLVYKGLVDFIGLFARNSDKALMAEDPEYLAAWIGTQLSRITTAIRNFLADFRKWFDGIVSVGGQNKSRIDIIKEIIMGIAGAFKLGYEIFSGFAAFFRTIVQQLGPSIDYILWLFGMLGVTIYDSADNAGRSKSILKFFVELAESFKPLTEGINEVVLAIVELIAELLNLDKEKGTTKNIFKTIGDALKKVAKLMVTFGIPIVTFIKNLILTIKELLNPSSGTSTTKSEGVLGVVGDLITGLLNAFDEGGFETFKTKLSNVINWLKTINMKTLLEAVLGGAGIATIGALVIKTISMFHNVSKAFKKIGEFFEDPGGILKQGFLGEYEYFSERLKNIAIAIGILAAVVVVLGSINPTALIQGGLALLAITSILFGFVFALNKIKATRGKQISTIATIWSLISLISAIVTTMSGLLVLLNGMAINPTEMALTFAGLITIFLVLGLFIKSIFSSINKLTNTVGGGKKGMLTVALSFFLVAVSIGIIVAAIAGLAMVLQPLSKMNFVNEILPAIGAITLIMLAIGLFVRILASSMLKLAENNLSGVLRVGGLLLALAASVVIIAVAVGIIALAIVPLAKLSWPGVLSASVGIGLILAAIGMFLIIMISSLNSLLKNESKNIFKIGTTLILLATSVAIIAIAIGIIVLAMTPLAHTEPKNILSAAIAVGIVMFAIGLFIHSIIKSFSKDDAKSFKDVLRLCLALIIVASAMVIMGIAIGIIFLALKPLADYGPESLAKVLISFVIVLVAIGIFIKLTSKINISNAFSLSLIAVAMVVLGFAIKMIIDSIRPFLSMDTDEIKKFLIGFGAIVAAIVALMVLAALLPANAGGAIALIFEMAALAGVIYVASLALEKIKRVDFITILAFFAGMAAVMAVMAATLLISAIATASGAASLLIAFIGLIGVIYVAGLALEKVKDADFITILAFFAGLSAVIAVMSVAMLVSALATTYGAASLLIAFAGLAGVMIIAGIALEKVRNVSFINILAFFAGLAVVIAVMSVSVVVSAVSTIYGAVSLLVAFAGLAGVVIIAGIALEKTRNVSFLNILAFFAGLAAVIAVMSVATVISAVSTIYGAVSLLVAFAGLAGVMIIAGIALEKTRNVSFLNILAFFAGLAVLIAVMSAATVVSAISTIYGAVSLVVAFAGLAGIMIIAGVALEKIRDVPFLNIISFFVGLSLALVAMSAAMAVSLVGGIYGAVSFLYGVIALSIAAMLAAVALRMIKDVDPKTIIAFFLGLSVALLAISVAMAVANVGGIHGAVSLAVGLAAVLAIITVLAPLLIGSLGPAITNLSSQLATMAEMFNLFSSRMSGVDEGAFDKAERVVTLIVSLMSNVISIMYAGASASVILEMSSQLATIANMFQIFSARMSSVDIANFVKAYTCLEILKLALANPNEFLMIDASAVYATDASSRLTTMADMLRTFSSRMDEVDKNNFDKLEEIVKSLNSSIGSEGNNFALLLTNSSQFSNIMWNIGVGLEMLENHTKDLSVVTAEDSPILSFIGGFAGCASDLDIIAKMDINKLISNISGLGGAMMLYAAGAKEITGVTVNPEDTRPIAIAIDLLTAISETFASQSESFAAITDMPSEEDLGVFGAQLAALAGALVQFEQAGSQLGSGTDKALGVLTFFKDLKAKLIETELLSNISYITMTNNSFNSFGVNDNVLQTFGANIEALGLALKQFALATSVVDTATGEMKPIDYSNAIATLDSIATLQTKLPNVGGFIQMITGEKQSLSALGNEIQLLGSNLMTFADKVTGKEKVEGADKAFDNSAITEAETQWTAVKEAVGVVSSLADISGSLPTVGSLMSIIDGRQMTLSDLGNEIQILGSNLMTFADLVIGGYSTDENGQSSSTFDTTKIDAAKERWNAIKGIVDIVSAFEKIQGELPEVGGVLSWITGDIMPLSNLGNNIQLLGSNLMTFADLVVGDTTTNEKGEVVPVFDPEKITRAKARWDAIQGVVDTVSKFSVIQAELPEVGGIKSWITGDEKSLSSLGDDIVSIGSALMEFSDKITGKGNDENSGKAFDETSATIALGALDSIVRFMEDLSGRFPKLGGLGNFIQTLLGGREFSIEDLTGYVTKIGTALGDLGAGIKTGDWGNITSSGIDVAFSSLESILEVMYTLHKMTALNPEIMSGSLFSAGEELIAFLEMFTLGTGSNLDTTGVKAMVDMMGFISEEIAEWDGAISTSSIEAFMYMADALAKLATIDPKYDWAVVGLNIDSGIAKGLTENQNLVTIAAIGVAQAAYNAAMEALNAHSPSRLFMEVGGFISEGLAIGITNGSGKVGESAEGMSDEAVQKAKDAIGLISRIMAEDVNSQPTISPVLDMSNVTNGLSEFNRNLGNSGIGLDVSGAAGLASRSVGASDSGGGNQNGTDLSGVYARMTQMTEEISSLKTAIGNMKLVLDSGVVAGAVTDGVDINLGRSMFYADRRN